MARGFKLTGEKELIRQLRAAQEEVLADLAPAVEQAASEALAVAKTRAPRGDGEDAGKLAGSAYKEPVKVDEREKFAAMVVGFEHERAAYIHEGRSWGAGPPRFLKRAVAKGRKRFGQALLGRVNESLARIFKDKKRGG
jgi:hypothetical protein